MPFFAKAISLMSAEEMLTVSDPLFESDEDSTDLFNQLVDRDEYNILTWSHTSRLITTVWCATRLGIDVPIWFCHILLLASIITCQPSLALRQVLYIRATTWVILETI